MKTRKITKTRYKLVENSEKKLEKPGRNLRENHEKLARNYHENHEKLATSQQKIMKNQENYHKMNPKP